MNPRQLAKYPNYNIYPDGRVYNATTGRLLNPFIKEDKMHYKMQTSDGRGVNVSAHRLVAMLWVKCERFTDKMVVAAKNGNYLDIRPSNLEWLSESDYRKKKLSLDEDKTLQIRLIRDLAGLGKYKYKEIGKILGVSSEYVGAVVNNRIWSHIK
jgi:hypothetical protein